MSEDQKKDDRLKALKEKREKLEALRKRKKEREQEPNQNDGIAQGISAVTDVDDLLKLTMNNIEPEKPKTQENNSNNDISIEKNDTVVVQSKKIQLTIKKSVTSFSVAPKVILKSFKIFKNKISNNKTKQKIELYNKSSQIGESIFSNEKKEDENENENKPQLITQSQTDENKEVETETEIKEVEEIFPEVTESEKQLIKTSENFQSFVDKASITMERAIYAANKYDILVDYAIDAEDSIKKGNEKKISIQTKLNDERWTKNRSVTDISWSPAHNELFAVSYSASATGSNDPDGVVLLWSVLNTLNRPEKIFTCQSNVTSTLLPKYYPTVVMGGTYSGQLVLWDTRAKSFPVQKTPLSSSGHTHPVFGIDMVGTQNANSLITISTDGKMCAWDLANLDKPKEVLELNTSNSTSKLSTTPVASTSLKFADGEVDNFFIGSESGSIFRAYRHGSESGIKDKYNGHYGLVSGLSFHSKKGGIDFGELFLSSSIDWTVKLWSQKNTEVPLLSLEEHTDYVFDVSWSPAHPSVFVSADGAGKVALWDLNEETEVSIQVSRPHLDFESKDKKISALNKLCWSQDGKKFVAGDNAGDVFVYGVSEALFAPQENDWEKFQDVLNTLKEGAVSSDVNNNNNN